MQNRSRSYRREQIQTRRGRPRALSIWIIALAVILLGVTALRLLRINREMTQMSAVELICTAEQDVTPFGEHILYYDGRSLHCLASNGAVRWSAPVNGAASFYASDTHVIVWSGVEVTILDANGRSTYNEHLNDQIQFARVGKNYAAIVIGSDTRADLLVRDLNGVQVDEESDAFNGVMLLDIGFYGDNDQYMWTLSLDVYGTSINSVLNTFQVGKMNTGEVSLGDKLAYRVLFANSRLRVFTTQQLLTFDYKGVQDSNSTMLVYGWEQIDSFLPDRGDANLLLVPNGQVFGSGAVTQLRVLSGPEDRRYTLPTGCVGAMVDARSVYAFSSEYIYRSDITNQRFYAYDMPLPEGTEVTAYLGKTTGGNVLLASGSRVYCVTLPK